MQTGHQKSIARLSSLGRVAAYPSILNCLSFRADFIGGVSAAGSTTVDSSRDRAAHRNDNFVDSVVAVRGLNRAAPQYPVVAAQLTAELGLQ